MKHSIIFTLLLLGFSFVYCMENSPRELESVHYKVERKPTDSLNFFGESQVTSFWKRIYEEDKRGKKFLMAFVKAKNSSVIKLTTNNIFNVETDDYRVLEALFIHFNNQEVYVTRRVDPSDNIFYETCAKKVCEWNVHEKLIIPQFGKWVRSRS